MKTVLAIAATLTLVSHAQASTLAAPSAAELHLSGEKGRAPAVSSEVSAVPGGGYAPFVCEGNPDCLPSDASIQLSAQAPGPTPESADAVTKEVPLPAAAWLFGSALVGFVMAANRRRI